MIRRRRGGGQEGAWHWLMIRVIRVIRLIRRRRGVGFGIGL